MNRDRLTHLFVFSTFLLSSPSIRLIAQHSDIVVERTNESFRTDRLIYIQDIHKSVLASGEAVFATDNPGFAGDGFPFRTEFFFDVVAPLRIWEAGEWTSDKSAPERITYFQPTPFGQPVNTVTIGTETTFEEGFLIQRANTLGRIHQHYTFELDTRDETEPRVAAYAIEMVVRTETYGRSPSFSIVINRGLPENDLLVAISQLLGLRASNTDDGNISISWQTIEGISYQLQRRTGAPESDWVDEGAPIPGDGDLIRITIPTGENAPVNLFRVHQTLSDN